MHPRVFTVRQWLASRSGRKVAKLMVVGLGLVWCSSWPGLLIGGRKDRTLAESAAPTAARLAALADAPDVNLGTVPADEAAARVRALLTRRAPGDLQRAGDMLDRALASPPPERARRRQLEKLRTAWRRVVADEEMLCPHASTAPLAAQTLAQREQDPAQAAKPGPLPVQGYR